jgi:serine/threonine-protein kinase
MNHPNSRDPGRNLLFGLLAFQNNFIDRRALVAAFDAWTTDKSQPLGRVLVNQGAISDELHALIDGLVSAHLAKHDHEPARSLAALTPIGSVQQELEARADSEVRPSLLQVAANRADDDPYATKLPEIGATTSSGLRFQILRPLNEGGMGIVSVALDKELDRSIALKEIRESAADNREYRARFLAEAEITGKLEHPGIIPIYGLGTYGDGRPFYAMRLIRGDKTGSLMDAIERFYKEPDTSARVVEFRGLLRRFLDVCNALAYAHSKGVLHRDLKPDNILLGPYGETLVVDWGLAKAAGRADLPIGAEGDHVTLTLSGSEITPTIAGGALGTPEYAPPEQMTGDLASIGARSDVYGLGAVLYCVLTGRPPFSRRESEPGQLIKKIENGDFPRPRQVRAEVDKPLEAICLKAMCAKPADRYDSVSALATDVESYLAEEPVSAHAEPWSTRARRWARKHRTLVSTAAASLVVALIGVGVIAAIQTRARHDLDAKNSELRDANVALDQQKSRAEDRETKAIEAVKRFGDTIANEPLLKNTPALEELRKKLLKEPLAFFRDLRERLQADRDASPKSLRRLAAASFGLASLTDEIGNKEVASAAYQEVLAIWGKLADANPAATELQRGLAATHNRIALMLGQTGKPAEALKAQRLALAIWQKLSDANPSVTEFQRDLATNHNNIGNLLARTGKRAEAMKAHQSALTIRQRLADDNPTVAGFQSDLAQSHINIGNLLGETGKPAEGLKTLQSALAILRKLAEANPRVTEFQRDLATSHNNIGRLLLQTGKPAEALKAHESALATSQKLADANPSVTAFESGLAHSHDSIGVALKHTGKPAEALKAYQSALAIRQKLADANPTDTEFQSDLAGSHNNIGALLAETGNPTEALNAFQSALAIQKTLADANPTVNKFQRDLAKSHNNIGALLTQTRKPAEALKAHQSALAIRQKLADANPSVTGFQSDLALSHHSIGVLLRGTGKSAEALKASESALAIRQGLADANPTVTGFQSDLAGSHNNIGVLLSDTGKPAEATKSHQAALAIRKKLVREHPEIPDFAHDLGVSLNNLAVIDLDAKRFKEARVRLHDAVHWQRKALVGNPANPTYRQSMAKSLDNLAKAARGLGDTKDGTEAERELAELRESDPAIKALDERLAAIIKGEKQPKDEADRLRLARRAYEKSLHSAAARLWADALMTNPNLGDDRRTQHRYNAACAAALAGSGQGKDVPRPDEAARAKLRSQALGWLQAELAAWTKLLESGPPAVRPVTTQTLQHWKQDSDLAGVREADALARLPEGERKAWQALWTEVDAKLKRAAGKR